MITCTFYDSPLGRLLLTAESGNLTGCCIQQTPSAYFPPDAAENADDPVLQLTREWLADYFRGTAPLPQSLPLTPQGSDFRQLVWQELLAVPYGASTTYGAIAGTVAQKLGRPRMSAQAVGGAVGHNPIGIIIPCHRVLGADGAVTGYAWGIQRKMWLLRHEGIRFTRH